jgi:hypothetical protein
LLKKNIGVVLEMKKLNTKGEIVTALLIILAFLGFCGLAALGVRPGIFMFC